MAVPRVGQIPAGVGVQFAFKIGEPVVAAELTAVSQLCHQVGALLPQVDYPGCEPVGMQRKAQHVHGRVEQLRCAAGGECCDGSPRQFYYYSFAVFA